MARPSGRPGAVKDCQRGTGWKVVTGSRPAGSAVVAGEATDAAEELMGGTSERQALWCGGCSSVWGHPDVACDLKRGMGSAPGRGGSRRSTAAAAGPGSASSASPPVPVVARSPRTSETTSSRTRATPMVAFRRAALRSCSEARARTVGCKSGGYHLPSEASHHRSPWRSSLKALPHPSRPRGDRVSLIGPSQT